MTFDRNIYQAGSEGKCIFFGGYNHKIYDDPQAFSKDTGYDARSIAADPQFVDVANGKYAFQPSSPAWTMQAGWLTVPEDLVAWENSLGPSWLQSSP